MSVIYSTLTAIRRVISSWYGIGSVKVSLGIQTTRLWWSGGNEDSLPYKATEL